MNLTKITKKKYSTEENGHSSKNGKEFRRMHNMQCKKQAPVTKKRRNLAAEQENQGWW